MEQFDLSSFSFSLLEETIDLGLFHDGDDDDDGNDDGDNEHPQEVDGWDGLQKGKDSH